MEIFSVLDGTFTWDPQEYSVKSDVQLNWAKGMIQKIYIQPCDEILDIGCGDGKITTLIASQTQGKVVGIDPSKDMIEFARNKFSSKEYPNVSFIQMDSQTMNLEYRFDIIFSNAALHWVKDHSPVLKGIKKSLKKGGKFFMQVAGEGTMPLLREAIQEFITTSDYTPYFKKFSCPFNFAMKPEQYKPLLLEAGLTPVRLELLPKPMVFNSRDELESYIRTCWIPYTQQLPSEKRNPFICELTTFFLGKNKIKDQNIDLKAVRFEVEAINN